MPLLAPVTSATRPSTVLTSLLPGWQWSECGCDGGTSSAGLRSKKPTGLSWKPAVVTGMIGQSSGRGTWWWPNVYQTTTSVAVDRRGRRSSTRAGPRRRGAWFGYSPAA